MKKLMTAVLLSLFLLTACGTENDVSEQTIETTAFVGESGTIIHDSDTDNTDAVMLTSAESEKVAFIEENTDSTSETTVTETATETEPTTAESGTEETAAAETSNSGAYSADKSALVGTWYAINSEYFNGLKFTFGEDGTVTISDAYENESGTYTVKNGLLELTLPYEDEDYIQSVAAVVYCDALVFSFIGLNTELIREEYKPYTADIPLCEYCKEQDPIGSPVFLSKERSVLAEQSDILGEWTVYEKGEATGKCVFNEDSITETRDGCEESMPIILKGGRAAFSGEVPANVSLSDSIVTYLCGGKLYSFENDEFPAIFEKCK